MTKIEKENSEKVLLIIIVATSFCVTRGAIGFPCAFKDSGKCPFVNVDCSSVKPSDWMLYLCPEKDEQ